MYQAKDRRVMLRVKAKSLAVESRIIRKEEGRNHEPIKGELVAHRRNVVRWHARATHVAYGLVKGVPIDCIEKPTRRPRDAALWKEVERLVKQYGPFDPVKKLELIASCHD